jgi:hypothetical protein
MIVRVRRNPTLKRRIRQIHRELSDVDQSIETLADTAGDPHVEVDLDSRSSVDAGALPDASRTDVAASSATGDRMKAAVKARGMHIRDERFTEYLSSNFQPAHPMKRERNVQRNKAIVMLGVLVIVIYWFVVRFWG